MMRVLLAGAVSFAAVAVTASGANPRTETLYAPGGSISGFAQDGGLIAWFAPDARGCNTVHVRSLSNGLNVSLPRQGDAHNVTCRWNVGRSTVMLAIADHASDVLWSLHESTPLEFDYLVGAPISPADRRERRFQQLAHTSKGPGLWFGGLAGNGMTLAYGVTSVDYEDEAGCLAGTDTCALKIAGGGVYRVVGGQRLTLIPGTTAAVAVAASGARVAYVAAGSITKRGRPVASGDLQIQVVDAATGQTVSSIQPQGTPVAIALAPNVLATLERTPLGLRLAWYSASTGLPGGSVPVALATSPALTVSDRLAVYHVGRSIRAVDLATSRVRTLLNAAAPPVGLSIEGSRLAWAENLRRGARIRAYFVTGRAFS